MGLTSFCNGADFINSEFNVFVVKAIDDGTPDPGPDPVPVPLPEPDIPIPEPPIP